MKKVLFLFCALLAAASCESLEDCVKSTGPMVSRDVEVAAFDKILVGKNISLVVTEGESYAVQVVSGENLIDGIGVAVRDGRLLLTDDTGCNWTRSYQPTTVHVTAPNLTEIESKTQYDINSVGILTYPQLKLVSLDLSGGAGTGDFHLQVNNQQVEISTNNVSGFYLSGQTYSLVAGFYEGNGILRAQELQAQEVYVFHRGSNNLHVSPVSAIYGHLYSTGNVFCWPVPSTVDVERHYQGRLIFEP
jgi:hypothetical protein